MCRAGYVVARPAAAAFAAYVAQPTNQTHEASRASREVTRAKSARLGHRLRAAQARWIADLELA
jgi:hypothetical protein